MVNGKIDVYYFPSSFYSQKALIALEEKGLKYNKHLVLLPRLEVWEPWYFRINPKGTVPALVHGDVTLTDSQDIIHYLEQTFPEPPLIPSPNSPEYRKKVSDCQQLLDSLRIDVLSFGSFAHRHLVKNPMVSDKIAKSQHERAQRMADISIFEKYAAANPDLKDAYEAKIQSVKSGSFSEPITEEKFKKEIDSAVNILKKMDIMIEENNKAGIADYWLCGPDFTEADIILSITLHRMRFVGLAYIWQENKDAQNIEKYYIRSQQRKSVRSVTKASMNFHTKMTLIFGHNARIAEAGLVVAGIGVIVAGGYALWNLVKK